MSCAFLLLLYIQIEGFVKGYNVVYCFFLMNFTVLLLFTETICQFLLKTIEVYFLIYFNFDQVCLTGTYNLINKYITELIIYIVYTHRYLYLVV